MMNRSVKRAAAVIGGGLVLLGGGLWWGPGTVRGPYLQQSTPTSVVVRWETSWPAKTAVRHGVQPDHLETRNGTSMRGRAHAVRLTGLSPATRYFYTVDTGRVWPWSGSRVHSFVTPPETGTPSPVRIWVLGDSGTGGRKQRAVRDAFQRFSRNQPPALWLMLGDNAYRNGTEMQYQKHLFDIYPRLLAEAPLWPALGNHDARSADPITQTGVYFDLFNLPARGQCGGAISGTESYYAFDYAHVHFVCLNSEGSDRSSEGPMLTWLREDLSQNRQTWTIAFWHQPPYSKGSHDSDHGPAMQEMRQNVLPLLEAAGVDLVLAGHSHSYERSFLLDGHYGSSDTFAAMMLKDGGDGRPEGAGPYRKPADPRTPHAGTVYVVAGSSGQTGRRLRPGPHPAMCTSLNVAGSLVLDVEGSRLDARFLDADGRVRDHFAILKTGGPASGT